MPAILPRISTRPASAGEWPEGGVETFLVRIWTEPDGTGVPEAARPMRGLVQHVRTGAEARFADPAELVGVLERLSRPVAIPVSPAGHPGQAEGR